MYGTIARLHPAAGKLDELKALARRFETGERVPAGFRHAWIFTPDANPYDQPTVFLLGVFEDRATYVANADSPQQDAEYQQLRALLEDDPQWMDGTFDGI
jgi:quinol monooxygenase YgiN